MNNEEMKNIINKPLSIKDKIINSLFNRENEIFSRKEIINFVLTKYPSTNKTSIIPTDYCFNRKNKGSSKYELFEYIDFATFKYIGIDNKYEKVISPDEIKIQTLVEGAKKQIVDLNMTKNQYIKRRIEELGDEYTKHTTSKTDWNGCIKAEVGDWPIYSMESSAGVTLELLLECKYSKAEIIDKLNIQFPDNKNGRRPQRVFNSFSGGKCRNIIEYRVGKIFGLKWNRYKFFNQSGEWINESSLKHDDYNKSFEKQVENSVNDSHENRKLRLESALKISEATITKSKCFLRNPDVVAEVLFRSKGICEYCNKPAPFIRAKDNTPYLEVHHKIQLSMGGEDTVENAIALCPNCHRYLHFGKSNT